MSQTSTRRRRFTADFRLRVVKEAMREHDSLKAIASRHGVHPNQVRAWRKQAEAHIAEGFRDAAKQRGDQESTIRHLHAKIGELTMERDFFQEPRSVEPRAARQSAGAWRPLEHLASMPPAVPEQESGLSRSSAAWRRRLGDHAADRCAAYGVPVLRQSENMGSLET